MPTSVSRRSFVKKLGTAGLGLSAMSREMAGQVTDTVAAGGKKIRNFKPTMKYREIGTTGVHVSTFSIGTTRGELEAINAGIDLGVNFIHTSMHYLNGKGIEMVAAAIKGRTDKVHIGLKDNFDSLEKTLKALGITCADFIFFARHDPASLRTEMPEIRKKFMEWRDKGLVKFAGVTSHKNMPECIDVAIEAGFFSCVMPTYGPKQVVELDKQRAALRKKGMSIVAMKTKGELDDEAYPPQITAALSDSTVSTVCRGVQTLEEVKLWSNAASNARTGWLRTDDGSAVAAAYTGCMMCGKCEGVCPEKIAVADIVRCVRYYHGAERDPRLARTQFSAMGLGEDLARCTNCGRCDEVCPQRIGVGVQLSKGRSLFVDRRSA